MSEPVRSCAGCGRKAAQSELLRFAAVERRLAQGRSLPGRGVYTCRRLRCFERARDRRAFNRVLKQTLEVDPALARLYTDSLENASGRITELHATSPE